MSLILINVIIINEKKKKKKMIAQLTKMHFENQKKIVWESFVGKRGLTRDTTCNSKQRETNVYFCLNA